jgi:hypothetical protein
MDAAQQDCFLDASVLLSGRCDTGKGGKMTMCTGAAGSCAQASGQSRFAALFEDAFCAVGAARIIA